MSSKGDQMLAVSDATKEIEGILENKFGARGKGLHTKALSIEGHLGQGLLRKIQFLATVRNKLMHEQDFTDVPYERFMITKKQVLAALDALDAGDYSTLRPTVDSYIPSRAAVARIRAAVSVFILAIIGGIFFFGRSRTSAVTSHYSSLEQSSETRAPSASAPEVPLWSVDHPKQAKEAFPWRAEQATFITAGETGPLPNETLWKTTSTPREVKVAGVRLIEYDIELGGGQSKGKVRLPIERTQANGITASLQLQVKTPKGASFDGMAVDAEGKPFDSFKGALSCQREIPSGCETWRDNGVTYIAVSLVSFQNALKVVYGAQ